MSTKHYGPDPTFDPVDSRWQETVNQLIEDRLIALFAEQIADEFHTHDK